MTCIVGLEHEGKVILGGDSAVTAGWRQHVAASSKVFTNGEFVFGLSGSPRMSQLLRYAFAPPWIPDNESDLERYIAVDFIDALREVLKTAGHAWKTDEHERTESSFLVGVRGQLFAVYNDYQIGRNIEPYASIGGGAELALGALYATQRTIAIPMSRLTTALEAASQFNASVAPPFAFVETP